MLDSRRMEELDMNAVDVLCEAPGGLTPLLWLDTVRALEALPLLEGLLDSVHDDTRA